MATVYFILTPIVWMYEVCLPVVVYLFFVPICLYTFPLKFKFYLYLKTIKTFIAEYTHNISIIQLVVNTNLMSTLNKVGSNIHVLY